MSFRWHIIRILLAKQLLRLKKNTAAYALLVLLLAIAILMAIGTKTLKAKKSVEKQQLPCFIVFDAPGGWMEYLGNNLDEAGLPIALVTRDELLKPGQAEPQYPFGVNVIEVHPGGLTIDNPHRVRYMHSGSESLLAPFKAWFWKSTTEYFGHTGSIQEDVAVIKLPVDNKQMQEDAAKAIGKTPNFADALTPELVGTVMLFAVQFFLCTHLLVAFTSQDRERGTLLALSLSPASVLEILASKFIFHVGLSVIFSMIVTTILSPSSLTHGSLWLIMILSAIGYTSVGIVMASFAKTQSAAGLLTMCYMLVAGVVAYLATSYSSFESIQKATFEHYSFTLSVASMKYQFNPFVVRAVGIMTGIVGAWAIFAGYTFHRRGWQ